MVIRTVARQSERPSALLRGAGVHLTAHMQAKIFAALSVCLALALGFAGCSKRETPVAASLTTKTIYLGNNADPRDLDPHIDVAYTDYNVLIALYEGLTVIDEATSKALPGMAERWDISDDGLTYTFHLRANARWSNGDPLTADDFAFSIQRILTPRLASENSYLLYVVAGADDFNNRKITDFSQVGVKVIDPQTLQIQLAKPTPYFLTLTAHQAWFPVEKATVTKYGDPFSRTNTNGWSRPEHVVTNGPYILDHWRPDQELVVKKNPQYYGNATNPIERVVFLPIPNPQVEESNFRTGQLHVTYDVMPDRIATFQHDDPDEIRVDPFLESFFIRFNVTKPPLNDKRVRQALARAIDRVAIAKSVMRGSRMPAYNLTPPNTAGYTCEAKIPTDYDAARKLLAEAGFPGGKGFPHLDIEMNSDPINLVVLEAIQEMWKKQLNIDVGIAQTEYRVYIDDQHHLSYQICRARWVGDYNDPSTFTDLFTSGSGNNDTGWKNPEYDRLVDAASREQNVDKRYALLGQAETILLDEAPIAPVFFGTRTYLLNRHLKGWVPSLLGIHRYQTLHLE